MRLQELEVELLGDPELRRHYASESLVARVGIQVLRLRLERGWTQTELAQRARTDQARIAHIEAGNVNLTLRRVAALGSAFGVDPADLIREPDTSFTTRKRRLRHVGLEFEWDADKARANVSKHGITFEEAATLFGDPLSATIPDPDHSIGEQRHLILGMSDRDRLVVVSFTDRNDTIRFIGARLATRRERKAYEEGE